MANLNPQSSYGQYKIAIRSWNSAGSNFCLHIPRPIAERFEGIKFTITIKENQIIFTSGQDISQLKKEIKTYSLTNI